MSKEKQQIIDLQKQVELLKTNHGNAVDEKLKALDELDEHQKLIDALQADKIKLTERNDELSAEVENLQDRINELNKGSGANHTDKLQAPESEAIEAKPGERPTIGQEVNYVPLEEESTNQMLGKLVQGIVEQVKPNGEALLKIIQGRPGEIFRTGAFYNADKKPGSFHFIEQPATEA